MIYSESGCTPLSASLIADRFSHNSRAFAMSLYTWGIYVGYGLAFWVGIYFTELNIFDLVSSFLYLKKKSYKVLMYNVAFCNHMNCFKSTS